MTVKLVIRITHGTDDVERAAVGLTVAATAIASGIATEVWLMNEAVGLGLPGTVESMTVEHAPPIIDLWKQVVDGGTVYACTQCMMRRSVSAEDLRDGVQQAGAPMLVASVAEEGAKDLSF